MNKLIDLILYRNPGRYRNPLLHPFLLVTLAFGISFAFFPGISGAEQTMLYKLTEINLFNWITSIWGALCIATIVLNNIAIALRFRWIGKFTAMLGFSLWLYAAAMYLIGGFWIGLFAAAIPNAWFWIWYYFAINTYNHDREAGRL